MLNEFVTYFEKLSEAHAKVQHVPEKSIHYAYLEDQKDNIIPSELEYPLVQFGHEGYSYTGTSGSWKKSYKCSLTITSHVEDTGDAALIERTIAEMEGIMDDFIGKMMSDRKSNKYKYLRSMDISNSQVVPVQGADDALFGCTTNFVLNVGWCAIPADGVFDDSKL